MWRSDFSWRQTAERKAALIGLLNDTTRAFDNMGIQYFLNFGTLLGARRHGGFIPWDDDIDLTIDEKDMLPLMESKRLRDEFGLDVFKKGQYLRISHINDHGLLLDLFTFRQGPSGTLLIKDCPPRTHVVQQSDVFPLSTISFEGSLYKAPRNADALLTKEYGTTWRTECVSTRTHHSNWLIYLNNTRCPCTGIEGITLVGP